MSVLNKTVVITGANAGIGFEMARSLAQQGAHIIMACRSLDKAEEAKAELKHQIADSKIDIIKLDVSELDSINGFIDQFKKSFGQLDILINNAGIVTPKLHRNSAGNELHLATNYLGAFALTGLLLPFFRKGSQTRIVNVGSLAHRFGRFDFNDPNFNDRKFSHWRAYAQSKFATAMFTIELNRRLQQSGSETIALGAHPGFAATDMGKKNGATAPKTAFAQWYQDKLEAWIVGKPAQAAHPTIYAASADDVKGGDYYGPTGLFEIKGKTGKAKLNPLARNPELGGKLWAASESLSGVSFLSEINNSELSLQS